MGSLRRRAKKRRLPLVANAGGSPRHHRRTARRRPAPRRRLCRDAGSASGARAPEASDRASTTHLGALGEGLGVHRSAIGDAAGELQRLMAVLSHEPTGLVAIPARGRDRERSHVRRAAGARRAARRARVRRARRALLLPLGIINQLNAPQTYLTVDRPLTDQLDHPDDLARARRRHLRRGRRRAALRAGRRARARRCTASRRRRRSRRPRQRASASAHGGAARDGRLELFGAPAGFAMGGSGYYGSASADSLRSTA